MILLIDNYDSFSFNLYQMLGFHAPDMTVVRNDALTVSQIEKMRPQGIVLSPGPGRPEDAGVCVEVVRRLGQKIPILGVCLGHQAICVAYGGKVGYAERLMHGKSSEVTLDADSPLFSGLPARTTVARYHSLAAEEKSLPESLKITAKTDAGEIMAVEHRTHPVFGVQFHPESILTERGDIMLQNFLSICKK